MPSSSAELQIDLRSPQAVARTSALLWRPAEDAGGCGLVLAPGAGTTIGHPTLTAIAAGIADRGRPVMAFNFAYAEAGRRGPDPMRRLLAAFADAAAAAGAALDGRPLVLGGRSMGGRVASLLAADGFDCAGLLLLSYPLHRPARRGAAPPAPLRSDHWPRLRAPVLFVHGDRDPMCDPALLEAQRRERLAAPSQVHVVAGADHSFGVRKRDGRGPAAVLDEVATAAAAWLAGLPVDRPQGQPA